MFWVILITIVTGFLIQTLDKTPVSVHKNVYGVLKVHKNALTNRAYKRVMC